MTVQDDVEYAENWDGPIYNGGPSQNAQDVEIYGILTDTDYNLIRSKPQYSPTLPTPRRLSKRNVYKIFCM
jgi:hypothetical protein